MAEGTKFDEEKIRMDLLDPHALEGLSAVLTFGSRKYAGWNWAKGIKCSRLIASMLRHTFALLRGEMVDMESGLPHIDHVQCNAMFLSYMLKCRPDMNDLPNRDEKGVVIESV